jgi:DNA-binding transcriptional regulator LsrR (DeoR family)
MGEKMAQSLEELIQQQTTATVVVTLSRTTERLVEKMAQEILKDRKFRARLQVLIDRAFENAWKQLGEEKE